MRTSGLLHASLFILVASPVPALATLLDPAFTETTLIASPQLLSATGMAWAPDGTNRLFIIKKDGEIRIVKDGILLPTPFATVTPLYTQSECGLIGIAFGPNFLATRHVYVFATVAANEQQIIRYTVDGDIGTAKTVVVPGLPTMGANHDGGGIGFGLDGKLYWAIGDLGIGWGANTDLTSLASKVGRANLDGTPVADNPFIDGAGPNADHIWARGFRNPFTFAFQPATGLLWVNDVGTVYEQVFVVRRGDHGGWNLFENNQPAGFITPVIKYGTNTIDVRTILPPASSGAVRAAGRVTFLTDATHGLRLGERVDVIDVMDTSFNGTFFVAAIPTATSFVVTQAGPDQVSGGGNLRTTFWGGAVTGGAFYDATGAPPAYQGNFFFGDYNSGFIMRAAIDPATNNITSIDQWATGISNAVDISLGPDGSIYYMGITSNAVMRATHNAPVQGMVVSPSHVWTAEGEPSIVMVRLALMPTEPVVVSAARASGDLEVAVSSGANLTFTSTNWNVPQPVTITAGRDVDTVDDVASIAFAAAPAAGGAMAAAPQTVSVRARDDNSLGLVVSTVVLALDEGGSGTFTVALSQQPSLNVTVMVARSTGDTDITTNVAPATMGSNDNSLTFTAANWAVAQSITVAAAADADGTDDAATITVAAAGMTERMVRVSVRDDDARAPMITSSPVPRAVAGAPYTYDVEATGLPPAVFSLPVAAAGMTIDPASGVIAWTPPAPGSFMVTVGAANGVSPDATQTFAIEVSSDLPPTCTLNRPLAGEIVTGPAVDFSGEAADDVAIVKAEFHIDGVVAYTDVGTTGRYRFGGVAQGWDTTSLVDGPHVAKLIAFDTAGQTCAQEVTVTVANGPGGGIDAGAADAGVADGSTGDGGARPSPADAAADAPARNRDNGCGCHAAGGDRGAGNGESGPVGAAGVLALLAMMGARRRRQRPIVPISAVRNCD